VSNALATRPNGNALVPEQFTSDELDLIKQTVAVGATNLELQMFLYQCKRTGLDPLAKQIYFIKRAGKGTIQTGIDGYRLIADRTGKYCGSDDPVFDKTTGRPEVATVTVYKLMGGMRCPFTASARWSEYFPGDAQGHMWKKMPFTMLAKCAEGLALRKAFPAELSGVLTDAEMDQADRTVDRITGEVYDRTPVQRHSDPPRDAVKHEREDGTHIHAPTIDPATQRPAAPVYRNEEEGDAHFAPRTRAEDATQSAAWRKGRGSHQGWMVNKNLLRAGETDNRALSLYLLSRAYAQHDPGRVPFTSRKDLTADDWTHCNNALAKLTVKDLNEWVQAFCATQEPQDSPFSSQSEMGADGDGSPYALGPCPACGSQDDCACTIEDRDRALLANRAAEKLTAQLLDVEPTRTGHGH
jgi:phage recombination protein Bet